MPRIAGPKDFKVAVLGAGRIGSSLVRSFVKCGLQVTATGRREETLKRAETLGALATRDNKAAIAASEIVIISVKPSQLPQLLKEVRGHLNGKIVVSIVAGVRRSTLEKALGAAHVYRAMPNVNASIGLSSTAVSGPQDGEAAGVVESILLCAGKVYWVPEDLLDAWTVVSGSMPAFAALIVDSLVLGGVSAGLPRELAMSAVLDSLRGTVEMLERGVHPMVLRDEVVTPAGVTIAGLKVMEYMGVPAALIKAVDEAVRRARELGSIVDSAMREG
ncbi:MAG: pyrroline-5-carboxylate reductase [Thermoprotei archaeon]|nr:pyrroline-5-carboxylate reductase [Thermoprotei archaeon]